MFSSLLVIMIRQGKLREALAELDKYLCLTTVSNCL